MKDKQQDIFDFFIKLLLAFSMKIIDDFDQI